MKLPVRRRPTAPRFDRRLCWRPSESVCPRSAWSKCWPSSRPRGSPTRFGGSSNISRFEARIWLYFKRPTPDTGLGRQRYWWTEREKFYNAWEWVSECDPRIFVCFVRGTLAWGSIIPSTNTELRINDPVDERTRSVAVEGSWSDHVLFPLSPVAITYLIWILVLVSIFKFFYFIGHDS